MAITVGATQAAQTSFSPNLPTSFSANPLLRRTPPTWMFSNPRLMSSVTTTLMRWQSVVLLRHLSRWKATQTRGLSQDLRRQLAHQRIWAETSDTDLIKIFETHHQMRTNDYSFTGTIQALVSMNCSLLCQETRAFWGFRNIPAWSTAFRIRTGKYMGQYLSISILLQHSSLQTHLTISISISKLAWDPSETRWLYWKM